MEFIIKKLNINNKQELLELATLITNNLTNKLSYITYNEEEVSHMFNDDYAIYLGAFKHNKLIATSAIFLNPNYTKMVREKVEVKGKLAEIGHCMVLPEYRGNNLMLQLNKKLIGIAKNKGVEYINFTVHPDNVASYTSMETLGAERKATYIRDKIYPRCIYLLKI
ncbi:MAG: GNAT family N-acetyltransferase [Clostridia bacterium]|jgi:RimJ/RimL family protein N-acetyltransferase|nr:GNAT family N-acetyltransferase [Clostridia bacterium]